MVMGDITHTCFTPDSCDKLLDFGDAPDGPYPTLLASNGARHDVPLPPVSDIWFGANKDLEPNGQPNAVALGDDLGPPTPFPPGDEDGVVVYGPAVPERDLVIDFTASGGPGFMDGWVDFYPGAPWAWPIEKFFRLWTRNFLPIVITFCLSGIGNCIGIRGDRI